MLFTSPVSDHNVMADQCMYPINQVKCNSCTATPKKSVKISLLCKSLFNVNVSLLCTDLSSKESTRHVIYTSDMYAVAHKTKL